MYGAILGDMIGAPFEFDRGDKTKDFELFTEETEFTDDSVMTIAVAEAMLKIKANLASKKLYENNQSNDLEIDRDLKETLISSLQKWGRKYPYAGYGAMFINWIFADNPKPYGSFGNGSAMRVSSVGWLFDNLDDVRKYARISAEVSHNHPEGIKGAEACACVIFLGRKGYSKEEIKDFIIKEFHYDLSRTCDEIRPDYYHVETCQKTVPEAITAFLEGEDFEDVIRTAVSLGGDCDTLTCIAGAMAESIYEIPNWMKDECRRRLPDDMLKVLDEVYLELVYPLW